MYGLLMCLFFIGICLLGFPISVSALAASIFYLVVNGGNISLAIVTQTMCSGINQYSMLAIPLFILAGNIMNFGGVTERIFKFCSAMVGHIPGGLGQVNVLGSIIFAGMSGSGTADAAGLGKVEIEAMKKEGYDVGFSAAVTAASACIGPIIPPSIPAVVYAVQAGVSTGAMFAAGVIPGLIMGMSQMVLCYFLGKKYGYYQKKATFATVKKTFWSALPALFAPVLIIGGSFSGFFTPTEAASVTVGYGAAIGLFLYRELKLTDLKHILWDTVENTAMIMLIMGTVTTLGWILTRELIPQTICAWIVSLSDSPTVVMLLMLVFLLIVGCFITPSAAILIVVPIIKPLVADLNIPPLQFAMLVVYTLCVGNVTPPVGNVLYITARVANITLERLIKCMIPWYIPLVLLAVAIVFFPNLSTWLPVYLQFAK
ncbi:TRAP transporter large permease [uncultured Cloacibacillus sp.]|uniref:TRAP transporter large permease n=1 Tax=uncultured Cloacibacillus sp. TaxID=889794 RepID=UPI003208BE24